MNINRWAVVVGVLLLAAVAAGIAYNIGITNGIEQSGKVLAVPAHGAYPYPYPYYGWHHRPWGFGFFFFPLFFIAFWLFVVRGLFWRRGWNHGGCGRTERFDEWHRQAHARMKDA